MTLKIDFSEKLSPTSDTASRSSLLNVGYLILQKVYPLKTLTVGSTD
jgi:hypothetical protein